MTDIVETATLTMSPRDLIFMELVHILNSSGLDPGVDKYPLILDYTAPLDWAVPLYGYVMPMLVVITTVTNSFIVIVLSQKHLRTPTNSVLLAMALTDLMTGSRTSVGAMLLGWTSVPWFLYYYTLGGYVVDQKYGMDDWWCFAQKYLADIVPSVFHTTAIWLTVFLAVQRYVYVCVPNSVHLYCTPKTTKIVIVFIFLFSIVSVMPDLIGKRRAHYILQGRNICAYYYPKWVELIGRNTFYTTYYWTRVILHGIPCMMLLIFTYKLGNTIKQAELRKRSWAIPSEPNHDRKGSTTPKCSSNIGGRSLYATNRMLAVICSVFLILEIPAAILFGMNFLIGQRLVNNTDYYAELLNKTNIIRHLLIVLTSPVQFAIYCSMSEQFRLTVRQLFTSRLLFVAQAQATFHGGKRYSLILVDVETIECKRNGGRALRINPLEAESIKLDHQRKKGRHTSVPCTSKKSLPCRNGEARHSVNSVRHNSFRTMPNRNPNKQQIVERASFLTDPAVVSDTVLEIMAPVTRFDSLEENSVLHDATTVAF